MERTTFGLLFYIRRDRLNKSGEASIYMRLTINGQRADASVKRYIQPHLWNSEKGKANEKGREGSPAARSVPRDRGAVRYHARPAMQGGYPAPFTL